MKALNLVIIVAILLLFSTSAFSEEKDVDIDQQISITKLQLENATLKAQLLIKQFSELGSLRNQLAAKLAELTKGKEEQEKIKEKVTKKKVKKEIKKESEKEVIFDIEENQ